MSVSDIEILQNVINRQWSRALGDKAQRYVGRFFSRTRTGTKIVAKVKGNHGDYTVSIEVSAHGKIAKCSCYLGKNGLCHHCAALAQTFLDDPTSFQEIRPPDSNPVSSGAPLGAELQTYLAGVTLDELLAQLNALGVTQKAFAEGIGMNPRHLSAIKTSELRNRFFNELGATKLACLWVIEHFGKRKPQ